MEGVGEDVQVRELGHAAIVAPMSAWYHLPALPTGWQRPSVPRAEESVEPITNRTTLIPASRPGEARALSCLGPEPTIGGNEPVDRPARRDDRSER